jgi:hypothetical protein
MKWKGTNNMPTLKAIKDAYTGYNEKFITENKIYPVVDFDFTQGGIELKIIDDFGAELWYTDLDLCVFSYKNLFQVVKITVLA